MKPLYLLVWSVIKVLSHLLFRLGVRGRDNVPKTGGVLLVANHVSNLDPPLVAVSLWRPCHVLAKEELFRVPVLGWIIARINAHPIRRGGVDRQALREGVEIMTGGNILLLFPEGTRSRDGNLQEAKPGAAMIAVQANVPIVPVYVDGSFRSMPRGAAFPRPVKIRVFFGEPFMPADAMPAEGDKRVRYEALAAEMMARIARLRDESRTAR